MEKFRRQDDGWGDAEGGEVMSEINGKISIINFKVSDKEIHDLSSEIGRPVSQRVHLSADSEMARILFESDVILQILRDGLIFEIIKFSVMRTYKFVKSKRPNAEVQADAKIAVKNNTDQDICIFVGLSEIDNDYMWQKFDDILTIELIESNSDKKQVWLEWSEEEQDFRVSAEWMK